MSKLFRIPNEWSQDIVGWIYALALIFCSAVDFAIGQTTFLFLFVVAILGAIEEKKMKKWNIAWPSNWWVLIFPVYFWKRLTAMKLPKHMFWIWLATAIFLSAAEMTLTHAGNVATLETAAAPLVTRIIQENLLRNDIECVKVSLGEEFAPDNYRAKAVLNNGEELKINIQRKDDSVIVRVE